MDEESCAHGMPDGCADPAGMPIVSDLGLTRRAFIGSSSVLLAVVAMPAAAQAAPRFQRKNGGVEMDTGYGIWRIERQWFSAAGADPFTIVNDNVLKVAGAFAGTNIDASCTISLENSSDQWQLRFAYNGAGAVIALSAWMAKGVGPGGVDIATRLTAPPPPGGVQLQAAPKARLVFPFGLVVAGPVVRFGYTLGAETGTAGTLTLTPFTKADQASLSGKEIETQVMAAAIPDSALWMRAALGKVVPAGNAGWDLGRVHLSELRLEPDTATALGAEAGLELWIESRSDAAGERKLVYRRRTNSYPARLVVGEAEKYRVAWLDDAELVDFVGSTRRCFVWKLATVPRVIQGVRYAASVRARQGATLDIAWNYAGKKLLRMPLTLLTLHVRGTDGGRYDIDYRRRRHDTPIFYRHAAPLWPATEMTGLDAVLTIGDPDAKGGDVAELAGGAAPDGAESRLHLGTVRGVDVSLDPAATFGEPSPLLRARRHQDALDLGFQFRNYRLRVEPDGAKLIPDSNPDKSADNAPQRAVIFNPQHIQEEAFLGEPAGSGVAGWITGILAFCSRALGGQTVTQTIRKLGDSDGRYAIDVGPTWIARSRASGRSRIVFQKGPADTADLSIAALTDWSDLALKVAPRAAGDMAIDAQLDTLLGFKPGINRAEAQAAVRASLVAPAADETALELVTGLVFSPDATARFRVPDPTVEPGEISGLWTAQLELQPMPDAADKAPAPAQVRAIWATGLDVASLFEPACRPKADPPFRTSLTQRDRVEIVMLSSAFGLAALRPVTIDHKIKPQNAVRLPVIAYPNYLDLEERGVEGRPDVPPAVQEGVYSPQPFNRFGARLTGFGADIDVEWQGEPPAPLDSPNPKFKPRFFANAFSVERYVHRTSLGSDIYVEVVYKGFLFPYGFRASLIKITEREPWVHPELGAMMPLVQRFFILPKAVEKAYPGIYQPFKGLEIPVRHARLLSGLSPELDQSEFKAPDGLDLPPLRDAEGRACPDPHDDPLEQINRVFWPRKRVAANRDDAIIRFDFEADDTGTRRTLPMLFLDNAAAHEPLIVRKVVEYYNDLADDSAHKEDPARQRLWLRTELHHNGRTIYAAPNKPGDTAFETDKILLKARGRFVAEGAAGTSGEDLPYVMDGFMEGADEPPFYPAMAEASISIPALDRIMGAPQGFKRVAFSSHYLKQGFDPVGNKGELYLNFLDTGGVMAFGGNNTSGGGLSRTPTPLAGISRQNAIVGAQPRDGHAQPPPYGAPGKPSDDADAAAPWNLADARSGTFDPAQFFGDAKLLGIVPIGEIVKAVGIERQPKLKEVFDYALGDTGDRALEGLKEACGAAADALDGALDRAETALRGFELKRGIRPDDPLAYYYPELSTSLRALSAGFRAVATDKALSLANLPARVDALLSNWRALRSAIDAVVANPAPEPVRRIFGAVRAAIDVIRQKLTSTLAEAMAGARTAILNDLVTPLVDRFVEPCFQAGALARTWPLEMLIGPLPAFDAPPNAGQLRALALARLRAGDAALAELAAAPLGAALSVPLARMLADMGRVEAVAEGAEAIVIEALAKQAMQVLARVAEFLTAMQPLLAAAQDAAAQICSNTAAAAAPPLAEIVALASEILPDPAMLLGLTDSLRDRLKLLELPVAGNARPVEAVRSAARQLGGSVAGLFERLNRLQSAHAALAAALPQLCTDPGQLPVLIGELQRLRGDCLAAFKDIGAPAETLAAAIEALPEEMIAAARLELRKLCADLILLAQRLTLAAIAEAADGAASALETRLRAALAGLDPATVRRATAKLTRVTQLARDVAAFGKGPDYTPAALGKLVVAAAEMAGAERELFAAATDLFALRGSLLAAAGALYAGIAGRAAKPLLEVHTLLLAQANAIDKMITQSGANGVISILVGDLRSQFDACRVKLEQDRGDLAALADPVRAAALLTRWRETKESGLAVTASFLLKLFDAIARGQVSALFDLSAARRAAEDAVRRLIPSRVHMHYDWDAELEAYPSDTPIFKPGPGPKHLTIRSEIEIDLLRPGERKMSISGTLKPFDLILLGDFKLVTVSFAESKFTVEGGKPHFKTSIARVEIGAQLKFLTALQKLMSTGDSGFRIVPTLIPPGVEVGYGFNIPSITFGALTISNVALDIAARLPFNGEEAEFRFAFASREQPFGLIVAPCYYGGGFVAISANAKGIRQLEIQLEFGAATDIRFGPLKAQGRVSTGIYLLIRDNVRRALEGFVHAVGEGQIACFGVSVNIEVKIVQEGDSMKGSASYKFSFRVGFVEVSYRFTATYHISGQEQSGGGAQAALRNPMAGLLCGAGEDMLHRVLAPDKRTKWTEYRQKFVEDWGQA